GVCRMLVNLDPRIDNAPGRRRPLPTAIAGLVCARVAPADDERGPEQTHSRADGSVLEHYEALRTTHVVIDRWFCTTVVFSGSRSSPPSWRVRLTSIASSTR